ncbi:MAG: hypothetical protein Q8L24_00700 [bacterium]|nr:hypothetical protein [bacterium]
MRETSTKEFCIVVKAYDGSGNMIGAIQKSFWLGGYQSGASTWVINSSDLTQRN